MQMQNICAAFATLETSAMTTSGAPFCSTLATYDKNVFLFSSRYRSVRRPCAVHERWLVVARLSRSSILQKSGVLYRISAHGRIQSTVEVLENPVLLHLVGRGFLRGEGDATAAGRAAVLVARAVWRGNKKWRGRYVISVPSLALRTRYYRNWVSIQQTKHKMMFFGRHSSLSQAAYHHPDVRVEEGKSGRMPKIRHSRLSDLVTIRRVQSWCLTIFLKILFYDFSLEDTVWDSEKERFRRKRFINFKRNDINPSTFELRLLCYFSFRLRLC